MIWYLAIVGVFCLVELRLLNPYLTYMPRFPIKDVLHEHGETITVNSWRRQFSFILLCVPLLVLTIDISSDLGWAGAEWPTNYAFSAALLGLLGVYTGRTTRQRDNKFILMGQEMGLKNADEYKEVKERLMRLKGEFSLTTLKQYVSESELNLIKEDVEKLNDERRTEEKKNRALTSKLKTKQSAISQYKKDIEGAKKRRGLIIEKIDESELELKAFKKKLKRAVEVEKQANKNLLEMLHARGLISNAVDNKRLETKQKKALTKKGGANKSGRNRKPTQKKK